MIVISLSAGRGNYIGSFPGSQTIPISSYDNDLFGVLHLTTAGFWTSYIPGSPFNAFTDFTPGSSYQIDTKAAFDIITS